MYLLLRKSQSAGLAVKLLNPPFREKVLVDINHMDQIKDYQIMDEVRDEEHKRIGIMFNRFRQKLTEFETLIKRELGELISKFVQN